MRIVYGVEVLANTRGMVEPQYETEDYYAVTGFAPTIDEAARKATRYMIDYLTAEHGLSREEAYVLCSLAGDLKITETVDVPHMLVSMHMPKSIFAAGPNAGSWRARRSDGPSREGRPAARPGSAGTPGVSRSRPYPPPPTALAGKTGRSPKSRRPRWSSRARG